MKRAVMILLVLIVTNGLAIGAARQDVPAYRSSSHTVPVFVTVTDRSDRLVSKLTRADFQVLDNGQVQPVTLFDNSPRPLQLIVMLDVSGSMFANLGLLRAACEELFAHLLPEDGTRVGTFGRDITISPSFTSDAGTLRAALPRAIDRYALTPLWRALDAAMTALADADSRRVIVVLSDGKDSGPSTLGEASIGQRDVIGRAERDGIMIYAVGLHSAGGTMPVPGAPIAPRILGTQPDPGLRAVALQTGGGYFEIAPQQNLGVAFARAIEELHSQYLLGFSSAHDGDVHEIEVRLTSPELKARARRTYHAPKSE